MNVKHTLRIARAAAEQTVAVLLPGRPKVGVETRLQLAPGLSVQYCLNTEDRAWGSGGGSGGRPRAASSHSHSRIQGGQYDVLWMAPMITGVVMLWIRLGLAASGFWPLY